MWCSSYFKQEKSNCPYSPSSMFFSTSCCFWFFCMLRLSPFGTSTTYLVILLYKMLVSFYFKKAVWAHLNFHCFLLLIMLSTQKWLLFKGAKHYLTLPIMLKWPPRAGLEKNPSGLVKSLQAWLGTPRVTPPFPLQHVEKHYLLSQALWCFLILCNVK